MLVYLQKLSVNKTEFAEHQLILMMSLLLSGTIQTSQRFLWRLKRTNVQNSSGKCIKCILTSDR